MYFSYFPRGTYDIYKDNNPQLVTNLLARVKVRSGIINNISLYDLYDVQEGETPEVVSLKHFGSPYYHWVVLLTNEITDRYYGWPLSSYEFEQYVNDKYEDPYAVHHYEVPQSSGPTTGNGPSDYTTYIEVNSDAPFATPITNYDYEQRLQDQKRQIKLLNAAYLPIFLQEFETLMAE